MHNDQSSRWVRVVLVPVLALLCPTLAGAQTVAGQPWNPQIQIGGFGISPAVVSLAGYDTNLTREQPARSTGPEFYIIPQARVAYRYGLVTFTGAAASEFIRAKDLEARGALTGSPKANSLGEGGVELDGEVVSFAAVASIKRTNARPTGFEIGARSVRVERLLEGRLGVSVSPRTKIGVTASRLRTGWDADAVYRGSVLATFLNSDFVSLSASLDYQLTPVTALYFSAEQREETYPLAPLRDNRSHVIGAGASFNGLGLLVGNVMVGRRVTSFAAREDGDVGGTVVKADLAHLWASGSSLTVSLLRDKLPSYDPEQQHYRVTGGAFVANGTVFSRWSVYGIGGFHRLSYRTPVVRYEDHSSFGGGISFRPRAQLRIGFQIDRYRHRSPDGGGQSYAGVAMGTFVIYGTGLVRPLDRTIPR